MPLKHSFILRTSGLDRCVNIIYLQIYIFSRNAQYISVISFIDIKDICHLISISHY